MRTIINYILNNKILANKLNKADFIDIIINALPGKHYSFHNMPKEIPKHSILSTVKILFFSLAIFLKILFKKRQKLNPKFNSEIFKFLILAPNKKFSGNIKLILNKLEGTNLLLSLDDIDYHHLNLKDYIPKRFIIAVKFLILFNLIVINALFSGRKARLDLVLNFVVIQKFIINVIKLNHLFAHIKFKYYLSLMPTIDHHYIIENFYFDRFISTYAIKTTTISNSPEHKFIKTQNLFYKSKFERDIFLELGLNANCILHQASILIEPPIVKPNHNTIKKILVIDTCLVSLKERNQARKQFVNDFYSHLLKLENIKIFHKFHPGLSASERLITGKILENYNNVSIIEESEKDYLANIDLVIGFYSTVFQDVVLRLIPLVVIDTLYGMNKIYQAEKFDFDSAPILRIKSIDGILKLKGTLISNPQNVFVDCRTEELHKWYKRLCSYPEGLVTFFSHLNSLN